MYAYAAADYRRAGFAAAKLPGGAGQAQWGRAF